jgi:phosphoglycerate dehydrogenase-like enzyme
MLHYARESAFTSGYTDNFVSAFPQMKTLAIIDDYENAALAMADWSPLAGAVEIAAFHDHVADEAALAERLSAFQIVCIMRERTAFRRSLLERLPNLEHLITSGMRNSSIDLAAARERGILVTGTPILPYPAAEHTWALILALAKGIASDDRNVRAGEWGNSVNVGLHSKTLGVVGLGKLGAQVARVGLAFGMRVIAWSANLTQQRCDEVGAELVDKNTLFRTADFVSIHLQLSERSRGLIGPAELSLMQPAAWLINTSRGPIVDEAALVAALQGRTIAGAGLDVFEIEPLPPDHVLRRLPNTVLTPHQGYVTAENFRLFFTTAVANILAWLAGSPINELR